MPGAVPPARCHCCPHVTREEAEAGQGDAKPSALEVCLCALPLHVQSCTETQVHTQVGIIRTLGHTQGCSCHTQIPTCTHMQDGSNRRRDHGSPMHTFVNMHPGLTLLDSRLKVGKGVQIKGSKSNSCLFFFFSLHPQSTSCC